jgi:aspartate carbamoyltransferase regulatory subunit
MQQTLSVPAIQNGTVIDHIAPGCALIIIHLLKISHSQQLVTIGLNLASGSLGLKDLIKIENRLLSDQEIHEIAVFAPNATINLVKDYKIEKKTKASLPHIIETLLVCPNTHCITNHDQVKSSFYVDSFKNKIQLRCKYCEKFYLRDEIKNYNI